MDNDKLIEICRGISCLAHKGTMRKYTGEPCDTHTDRVALRVDEYCKREEYEPSIRLGTAVRGVAVGAAHLHDVIEDTKYPREWIVEKCGIDIYLLVLELTNPSKMLPKLSRAKRKEVDRIHLHNSSRTARIIKLFDRIDNVNDMHQAPKDFRLLYSEESEQLLKALRGTDMELEDELQIAIDKLRISCQK